jgi:hypothetical protein
MAFDNYSLTPSANISLMGINVGEGMLPSSLNNAIRQLMADGKALSLVIPPLTAASVTFGVFGNAAKTNIPRGLAQSSVGAITPGSGGTNGTFNLAWTSGNFSVNPTGTFTVAGGVLTAVTITGTGLYIGASPIAPTPSFAALTGLTGAAVALTPVLLVTSGNGYWVQSSNGLQLDRYYNSSGVATADTTVSSIPTGPDVISAINSARATLTSAVTALQTVADGAAASAAQAGQSADVANAAQASISGLLPVLNAAIVGHPFAIAIGAGDVTFETIGLAKLASIPGTASVIDTRGYFAPGDPGGARYKRVSADPAIGAGGFRSVDRFLPDGSTDSANGGWWRIVTQGGVDIEPFGGACDCPFATFSYPTSTETYPMPTAGTYTDNLQPLYDALRAVNVDANVAGRNEVGSMIPIRFMQNTDTTRSYGFSGTIIPQYSSWLLGTFSGGDSVKTGTTFRFPPNTKGLRLNHFVGQPAGYVKKGVANSRIEGIWFQGGGGTDRTAHGISHRISVYARNCAFAQFAGNNTDNVGFTGVATTDERFGLTSGSSYENVFCLQAGNWNSWVEGSDVSASVFYNLHHKGSRLGGLYEGGYFGNQYLG